ncbi:MAG: hybrid sensor histidine kinase/response regulator [Gammaproteobacteria bacterium]|nr:hybrid sensor histidine kinase/response regulator [Gammaproteobacteria bacterium]
MRRRFNHDALFILLICSWIPVAIAAALILVQMNSYLGQIDQARVQHRLDQAKIALNSQMLSIEAIAEILLASRELNDFIFIAESVQPMTGNLLYGRISSLKAKAPEILSFTILDKRSARIFSFPPDEKKYLHDKANDYGFSLVDQNTLRYYRPIAYDDQEFPGPSAKLKGFLVLEIDLSPWRKSLGDPIRIDKISTQPSISGIDLEIDNDNAVSPWQYVPYLIVLVIVLMIATMAGLYLMRSRIVKPITNLTHYVSQQMDKAPGYTQHHELAMLKESFESYIKYERELKAKLLQQSTLAAIGRTTQMLAHDVRKPFAMLKGLVHLTRNAKDPASANALLRKLAPEIDKAVLSAEGLIRDIMEVGSTKQPNQEIVHLSSLIQTTLNDAFRIYVRRDIKFRYALKHHHALLVDPIKVSRIFSNITFNAIEAMRPSSELWFKTREFPDRSPPMIEVVIGNSGSFVVEEKREQIFDAFFTEGKHSGVGLGLAIVRKLVIDHGGDVSCRSSQEMGTEFVFTLPMADVLSERNAGALPAGSSDIIAALQIIEAHRYEPSTIPSNETKLAERIMDIARQSSKPVKVLVADDESLYQRVLESHVEESSLKSHVQLVFVNSAEKALETLATGHFDIVIMDVNFGKGRLSGFEAVKRLRESGNSVNVCIHSSHGVLEYQSKVTEAGANLFMLKPMSKMHLLNLIYSTVMDPRYRVEA